MVDAAINTAYQTLKAYANEENNLMFPPPPFTFSMHLNSPFFTVVVCDVVWLLVTVDVGDVVCDDVAEEVAVVVVVGVVLCDVVCELVGDDVILVVGLLVPVVV